MPTTGERLVRIDFNVSASSDVDAIKRAAAELIDRIEALDGSLPDAGRHKALASPTLSKERCGPSRRRPQRSLFDP